MDKGGWGDSAALNHLEGETMDVEKCSCCGAAVDEPLIKAAQHVDKLLEILAFDAFFRSVTDEELEDRLSTLTNLQVEIRGRMTPPVIDEEQTEAA